MQDLRWNRDCCKAMEMNWHWSDAEGPTDDSGCLALKTENTKSFNLIERVRRS